MSDNSQMSGSVGGEGYAATVEIHTKPFKPQTLTQELETHRRLSNGNSETNGADEANTSERSKVVRQQWLESEENVSADTELPIHDQIKQGILGFVAKEIKKSDGRPIFGAYHNDRTTSASDESLKPTCLMRPSSGHKEKRSPSHRRRKRHHSKQRERDSDFECAGAALTALEKVDDYLKQYNRDQVVSLSGDLEIADDLDNNNGQVMPRPRKGRKKYRLDDGREKNTITRDVSPKVFNIHSGKHSAHLAVLKDSDPDVTSYLIDNPFSSPSPMTSPNDGPLENAFGDGRPDRVFMQRAGTFRAVAREKVLGEAQRIADEQKYFRLDPCGGGPVEVALRVQRAWGALSSACPGVLAGAAVVHLMLLMRADEHLASTLQLHALITLPYVTLYMFLCVVCLLSVLDRLDVVGINRSRGIRTYVRPAVLMVLYAACLLLCAAARPYDEAVAYQQMLPDLLDPAYNVTMQEVPGWYRSWSHLCIWRCVLCVLALAYLTAAAPPDLLQRRLATLLQDRPTLQPIG